MKKNINLLLVIIIFTINNIHPNIYEILNNISKEIINKNSEIITINTKTNINTTDIETLQTKSASIDTAKNDINQSYSHWTFKGTPADNASFIRDISTRLTRSDADGEPSWIAVTNNSEIITSFDGITWYLANPSPFPSRINGITNGIRRSNSGFRWLAVGHDGKVGISIDGNIWTLLVDADLTTIFGTTHLHGVEIGYASSEDELWVIVGYEGKIGLSTSLTDEPTNWYAVGWSNYQPITRNFYRVKYGYNYDCDQRLWIAVGTNRLLAKSSNGSIWTTIDMSWISSNEIAINSVNYEDGLWVICTEEGKILTSIDGTNWLIKLDVANDFGLNVDFYDVAYGDGRWVAAGYDVTNSVGTLAISTDGATWKMQTSSADDTDADNSFKNSIIYAIKQKDGFWMAAGENAKLASGYIFWD